MSSEEMSQGTFDILWDDLLSNVDIGDVQNVPESSTPVSHSHSVMISESSDRSTCISSENVESQISSDHLEISANIIKEMTPSEFQEEHGFDINMLFDDMETMNESDVNMLNTISSPKSTTNPTESPITESISNSSLINTPSIGENVPTTSNNQEFVNLSSDDVRQMISDADNRNTVRKTLYDVSKFQRFLDGKGEQKEIHRIEPDLLDEYLANFILSVRKPDGEEYEPSTIRNMVSSIDRKLKRQNYPHRIISSTTNAFNLSKEAMAAKQKSLKRLGKGNKPKKASPITDEEIDQLYEKNVLGTMDAKALINTLWFNNCVQFGLRGNKENYNLR